MIEVFHFVLVLISYFFGGQPNIELDPKSHQRACQAISDVISSRSAVYYPGNPFSVFPFSTSYVCPIGSEGYMKATHHWGLISAQPSACTVEPGDARDIGKIVSLGIDLVKFHVLIVNGHRYSCKFLANPVFLSASVNVQHFISTVSNLNMSCYLDQKRRPYYESWIFIHARRPDCFNSIQ